MAQFQIVTLSQTPVLRRADRPGDTIRFSKQLAVLIYLAARPAQRASREELTGLLWGGSSSFDARQALRQVVYQLRHSTGPDVLRGDEVLSLCPGALEFDVDDFRRFLAEDRLEEALEIYEADLLATVSLPGASEFEHWAEGLRQQLAAERRQIIRTLIARRADEGRWQDAAHFAEQLADADPEDLEPRIRRIELLALAGDVVRAVAAADAIRRLVAEREGEPESSAVEHAIARALSASAAPERRAGNGFPGHPEMVGRAVEFRRVVDAWKRAQEGRGGAVLITGEAGIGKTRLSQELERRFRRDRGLLARTACYAIEQSDAFGPFLDALRALYLAPGLAGAAPACLEILAALVPEVADRFASGVRPRLLPIPPQAIAASLGDAFAAIAEEAPLALVVEDLHWASAGTVELAHQMARRAANTRVLLLFTARDFGGSPATMKAVRELSSSGAVSDVSLESLDRTDVEQLLASMAQMPPGDEGGELSARIHHATDGIPLYVLEVLKSLHDVGELSIEDGLWRCSPGLCDQARSLPVPSSAGAILEARLTALGEPASLVLASLAVLGRAAAVTELAGVAGLNVAEARAAAQVLERRRLIGRANGAVDTWMIAHDELAAAALRSASPAFVELLHARAAGLAESRAGQGKASEWTVAASHAARAGDATRTAWAVGHAVAEVERASGAEVGRGALDALLESMPESVRSGVVAMLLPVQDGRWTARRWLQERDGTRRRRTRRRSLLTAGAVGTLALGFAAFLLLRRPPAPLGGGYLALGSTLGSPQSADVRAYRLDHSLSLHGVTTDALPRGLREGFPAEAVRPDQRLATWPCGLPDIDPVVACAKDLLTGDTAILARHVLDTHVDSWLPDGSGFLANVGDTLPNGRYFRYEVLRDAEGKDARVLAREPPRSFLRGYVSPRGDRGLVAWQSGDSTGTELHSIRGGRLGAIEWCVSPIGGVWSPDAARLACVGRDGKVLAVGESRPGGVQRQFSADGPITSVAWSPDGRYLAFTVDSAGTQLHLIDGQNLAGPIPVGARSPRSRYLLGWSATAPPEPPARLVLEPRDLSVAPGEQIVVQASATDVRGQALPSPPFLGWSVADTTVARVSDAGVVTADRTGATWLFASLGLRAADSVHLVVRAPVPRELLREDFERGLDTVRWRSFGWPPPLVLAGRGLRGSSGFNNNGDRTRGSGVASRTMFDLSGGLTVTWWSRVPFSGREWQGTWIQLVDLPADSFRQGEGELTRQEVHGVSVEGPSSNGSPRSISLSATGGTGATSDLPRRLDDPGWHRYRLVVYPSGEVRWFADGVEVVPPIRADLRLLPRATLVIQGQSYRTHVMVDDVAVWKGVVLEPAASVSQGPARVNPAVAQRRTALQGGHR